MNALLHQFFGLLLLELTFKQQKYLVESIEKLQK